MFKNTTGQKWRVFAFDATDNTPKTGDAANITGKISKDFATAVGITDTNPTEIEDGYYDFNITQTESDADTLNILPESSTADIQVIGCPATIFTRPPNFTSLGIESDGDLTKVNTLDGHTAQTADHTSDLSAVKTIIDALPDSGALTTIGTDTARMTAARAQVLDDWMNTGRLDNLLDAIPTDDVYERIGVNGAGLTNINLPDQVMNITGNLSGSIGSVINAVTTDTASRDASKADVSGLATPTNITAGTITTVTNLTNAPTAGDLTGIMKASINTEVDTALSDIKLDRLIAVAESDDPVDDSIISKIAASNGDWSGFSNSTDSLEAIRDRGDTDWSSGAASNPNLLLEAEINTVTDQTHFTLATGSDDDDAYNGQAVVLYDDSNSDYPCTRVISDYVGSTRTVTIDSAPVFTLGTDDSIKVFVTAPGTTAPTAAAIVNEWETQSQANPTGFQVNVREVNGTSQTANDNGADINTLITEIGTAGAGLTNINLPDQTMNITGSLSGSVGSVTADVTTDTASRTASKADVSGLATTTELDKVPKSDGSTTWNNTALASVNAEVDTALSDYNGPTNTEFEARSLPSADYTIVSDLGTVQSGDAYARIGSGGSALTAVRSDIAGVKTITDNLPDAGALTTIGTDTARMTAARAQVLDDWINGGRLDLLLDAVKVVTDALTSTAATKLALSTGTIVTGAAESGTLSTTQMTSDLTESTDNHYNGRIIIWTSGVLKNQATDITDYTGSSGLLTYTAVTEAPSAADTFLIV